MTQPAQCDGMIALPRRAEASIFVAVPRLTRFSIALILVSMACALAAPALCAGRRAEPMPCCDADRDCGAALGRPSCCVDAPGDAGRAPGAVPAAPAPVLDTPAAAAIVPVVEAPAAFAGVRVEARPLTGDPPPLFLLHAAFLC